MRVEETKVFKFEELSEEAKEVAREWYKSCMDNDFYYESEQIKEDFKYELEKLGYPTNEIEFSLNHSQGDGVAFYGHIDDDDMEAIVKRSNIDKKLFDKIKDEGFTIFGDIERNQFGWHYSHWNTMKVEIESDDIDLMVEDIFELDREDDEKEYYNKVDEIEDMLNELETFVSDEIKEASKNLESLGYKMIEDFYSNERIDEIIIINEYEFTEDGSRW